MRNGRLCDPVHGVEVGLQGLVEVFRRHLRDVLAILLAASVDDQDVQSAQLGHGLFDHLPAPVFIGDVAGKVDGFAAFSLDQRDDFGGVLALGRQIGEGHIGAFPSIGDGGRAADAAVRAGDQGLASFQLAGTLIAVLAMIGLGVHLARFAGHGLRLAWEGRLWILLARILKGQSISHGTSPFRAGGKWSAPCRRRSGRSDARGG